MGGSVSGGSWDVFLAYASPDRARAQELFEALTAAGLRVCFDHEVLQPGDDWHRLLPRYLRDSSVVVALISASTEEAHYQRSELVAALDMVRREGRRLVPVRLGTDAWMPYGTEQLHRLDMLDAKDVAVVAERIKRVAPSPELAPALDATQVFCERIPAPPRFFTGRDALLARLADAAPAGSDRLVVQAVHGMGGIGKTSLVAALVDGHRHGLDVVWWVRAEEPALLVADLAELAPRLGLPPLDDPADAAAVARRELERTDRSWMVVFDNAPDQRALESWVPERGRGWVVITSRSTAFDWADEVVPVETFPSPVAETFLRDRVRPANPAAADEDLDGVLARLGGLPLALEQAAAWVARIPSRRFSGFVQLYDDVAQDPFPDGTRPWGYDHTASTTWRVSVAAATQEAPLAKRLMAVLGLLAPEELPRQWFRDMGDDPYFDRASPAAIDQAADALHTYALATISPEDTITVHRVILSVTRRAVPPQAAGAAIRMLRAQLPDDPTNPSHWPVLATLLPHALVLAETATQALPEHAEDLWLILAEIASYQSEIAAVSGAITTATMAFELARSHLGPEHRYTLTSRCDLATAHQAAGDLDRAITLHKATLADRERILGPKDPDTLASRHDLALAYQTADDLDRAMPLHEATLADNERILGPDHPHTLATRHNLATAYEAAGDLDRAIPLLEATLADHERILGPDHPRSLSSRNNLAQAYQAAGDLDRAIPLLEATLADLETILGPDHPKTIATRNNLAEAHAKAGQTHRAIPLLEASLASDERVLGLDHPATLTIRQSLALTYQAAGKLDRAILLLEATLVDHELIFGPDHPDTVTNRHLSAVAYQAAGKLHRAIPLHEAVLADRERILGPDHPDTLDSRNNLAGDYLEAGKLDHAVPLLEAVLAVRERTLGPDHRHTLTSRSNLATAYQDTGDLERAIPLFEATLADAERTLGSEHPNTLASRGNLATAYRFAGQLDRAIRLHETILADRERILGPDHPQTLITRNNLATAYQDTGDLERAIPLLENTLADRQRVLGPDHPQTLTSRGNLALAYKAAGDLRRALALLEATLADRERVLGADHPHTQESRKNLEQARLSAT